jgi:hypothetical protein
LPGELRFSPRALKSQLRIPLAHVVGAAEVEDEARQWLHGSRLAGTDVPGVISAGRFYSHDEWVFWDVQDQGSRGRCQRYLGPL